MENKGASSHSSSMNAIKAEAYKLRHSMSSTQFDKLLHLQSTLNPELARDLTNIEIRLTGKVYNENYSCSVFTSEVFRILVEISDAMP